MPYPYRLVNRTHQSSPDETSFTALNERITGDWGLGTGDWELVFLLSTQHSALSSQMVIFVKQPLLFESTLRGFCCTIALHYH
ncbi:hypothetical protein [Nostoc sp.]